MNNMEQWNAMETNETYCFRNPEENQERCSLARSLNAFCVEFLLQILVLSIKTTFVHSLWQQMPLMKEGCRMAPVR